MNIFKEENSTRKRKLTEISSPQIVKKIRANFSNLQKVQVEQSPKAKANPKSDTEAKEAQHSPSQKNQLLVSSLFQ